MKYKITYQNNNKIYTTIIEAEDQIVLKLNTNYPKNILNIKILKEYNLKNILTKQVEFSSYDNKKIYQLFSSLNIMLNSSITISDALDLMLKSTKNEKDRLVLNGIKNTISSSDTVGRSLKDLRRYLSDTTILFLELGLQNGTIKESINSIVIILKEEITTKDQLLSTLRYPLVLVISLILSVSMIFIYVLPNFEFIFLMFKDDLPMATQSLLFIKNIFINYNLYILFFIIFIITLAKILYIKYQYFYDKLLLLNLPLFSNTIKSYYLFKLFLSLSIIVKSKYQFQTAMENSKNIVSNKYMQNILDLITTQIKQGISIGQSFKQSNLFDDFTIKLLYVAQYTSSYDKILEELTLYYKEKFKKKILDFSSVIEPLLVSIISLIVLWLILAIMLPIWQMSSVIN